MSAFVINSYAFGGGEDPDAAAYLNAVESADTQALEAAVRKAVDDFVKGLKADGIWSAIKASCILAGARTLTGALVPLVGSAPTNVGDNFVSGDYDRETGLLGDRGTKRLDSNRANNSDPQDDQHLAIFIHSLGNTTVRFMGSGASAGDSTLGENFGSFQIRSRNSTNLNVTTSASKVPCFFGKSRAASGNFDWRVGSDSGNTSQTSQAPTSSTIEVFRAAQFPTNARISFYSLGEALDLAALETRVATLMTDLDAAI